MNEVRVVLDEDDVRRTLVRKAHEIVEKNAGRPIALVGIHRRGAHLATRLHALVEQALGEDVPRGAPPPPPASGGWGGGGGGGPSPAAISTSPSPARRGPPPPPIRPCAR